MKEDSRKEMQEKLANYSQAAPDVSWEALEKALAANKVAASPRREMPLWRIQVAAAAIILLVAGIGWRMVVSPDPVTKTTSRSTAKSEFMALDLEPLPEQHAVVQTTTTPVHSRALLAVRQHIEEQTAVAAVTPPEAVKETSSETPSEKTQQQPADRSVEQRPYQEQTLFASRNLHHRRNTGSRLTAKVYMGNTMSGSSNASAITPMMAAATPIGTFSDALSNSVELMFNQTSDIEQHVSHHQPLRFGVSLRYQLSERWSVESGLTYSLLSSDITRRSNNFNYHTDQKLTYVGIPVNVNYLLWSNRHFNVYGSAGTTVEKMVHGHQTTQSYVGGKATTAPTEHVTIRPLQWSFSGAAGVEYKIDRVLSFYAEPGLSFHLDNHSEVPTYYQDKPLGFNLNMGLRFNFSQK
jgi:hypothetical protein